MIAVSSIIAKADEGMWLPYLISQNYEAMAKLGYKLTADDIYSVNKSCMKDAVLIFGGGCTGEIISQEGLVLTNHHCGYDAIAGLSSVEKNYLMNGFAAANRTEEMACPGLSVKILNRIEDVTAKVVKATKKTKGEAFDKKFESLVKKWEAEQKALGFEVDVRAFYSGNQYLMMVYERFTDIRLVATPSESLGKFGGDTDNWMWPRHTCDFSMFRIYTDNNNKPAAYSINNRPYQPKYHFPINIKGVKEGDYAMTFGYPGRTTRYLTSYGVDLAVNESNPSVVKIRDKRLGIMKEEMNKDMATELKYASSYASLANYWKYFIGQTEQLKRLNVVDTKRKQEAAFNNWAADNKSYRGLFDNYQTLYDSFKNHNKISIYQREAFNAAALSRLAGSFYAIKELYGKSDPDTAKIAETIKNIKAGRKRMIKAMDLTTDKKVFSAMNLMYYQDIPKDQHPTIFSGDIFKNYGSSDWGKTFDNYTEYIYNNTSLLNDTKFDELMAGLNKDNIEKDPAIAYAFNVINNYKTNHEKQAMAFGNDKFELDKSFLAGLMKKNAGTLMYPDANGTLRLSYGVVKAYQPKDAVAFNYYTTGEGLLEKYKAKDAEFDLPENVVELLKNKDYGQYADKNAGTLITCFITNNDITGGNSGSPVINGNGEIIGCAFDGNWEAMSGDVSFDQKYKRTIVADIRYILWVLDKGLGGKRIIEEITLRK
jgi:hypothetical protein